MPWRLSLQEQKTSKLYELMACCQDRESFSSFLMQVWLQTGSAYCSLSSFRKLLSNKRDGTKRLSMETLAATLPAV